MEIDFIKTELQKFNVADAVIAKMSADYLPLKVKGLDDREGFKKVHDARIVVRDIRIEVEKKRKQLKESSLRFGQAVDGEAKRINKLLSPIETHLENEESIVEREKERLRLEVEQKEQVKIRKRVERLQQYNHFIDTITLGKMTEDVFEREAETAKIAHESAQKILAEMVRQKQVEAEQLEIMKKKLEIEKKRQDEVTRVQIEALAKIKTEQKKIEDEKKLIAETKLKEEQEKKRLVDLEKARKEAAEKAMIETENRIKREAEAKLEAERQAEIEAKRKEALKPDKEKLLKFAKMIDALEIPEVSNSEVAKIIGNVRVNLGKISHYLISESNKL